jgi:hypothetical protein
MEIAFAALFLVPATMKLGFILASCYFGGAIATDRSYWRSPAQLLLGTLLQCHLGARL